MLTLATPSPCWEYAARIVGYFDFLSNTYPLLGVLVPGPTMLIPLPNLRPQVHLVDSRFLLFHPVQRRLFPQASIAIA